MKYLFVLFFFIGFASAQAKTTKYVLNIKKGELDISGKIFKNKLFINGTIPAPELVFHNGDIAEIRVINHTDEETLIHWHGILLPNDQDGVPYVTSAAIRPHSEKIYRFPIKQTGTYWYHSHTMFQEEDGLYGALKFLATNEPNTPDDQTLLLADLTKESGQEVHRNLKKDGEYYDVFKGTVQSWLKAFQTGAAITKWRNSLQRMEGMDYADVAYELFTANGKPETFLFDRNEQNKQVKLRIINGSATSIFKLTYAGGPMTVIAADGLPVEPARVKLLPISVGETYDVLVDLEADKKFELRATSLDNSGHSSTWLGQGKAVFAPSMPWENPLDMTMGEMMGMENMGFWSEFAMGYRNEFSDIPSNIESNTKNQYSLPDHKTLMPMMNSHKHMDMKPEKSFRIMNRAPENRKNNLAQKGEEPIYNELTYGLLRAKEPIDDNPNQKLRIINFSLNGNMENFVWTINGRPVGPKTYIKIYKNERVRFIMKNTTMMNHPMHLHGHFFRVMTNQGKWSVLKHTVNVAPLDTTVIEFNASEEKDWFFHCHNLYHMMDGMARIVRYTDNPGSIEFEKAREESEDFNFSMNFFLNTKILAQNNYARTEGKFFNSYSMLSWDVVGNYDKDLEGEIHVARTLTRFFSPYIGAKTETENEQWNFKSSPTFGFTWVLPLNLKIDVKYQPLLERKIEMELENEIHLTDKLQLNFEYSSIDHFYSELEYRQTKNLSFVGSYNKTYEKWGIGLGYTY